jgi:predicted metal-dependent phosphoesterase TrpH
VELISLTDHDTLAGVAEAQRTAEQSGITCLSGVEISSLHEETTDLHILGYLVDLASDPLQAELERGRLARETRASRMVERLKDLGYAVNEELLAARAAAGEAVGRPHIAQATVGHPANAQRLAGEGLLDPTAFLVAYLVEGRPAFVGRYAPPVRRTIEMIHDAGGLAVWAHPFWDFSEPARVRGALDIFVGWGLDGVEVFYATHTEAQTRLLARQCAELELVTTGSSDFHGPGHRQFNRFRSFQTYGLRPNLGALGRAL